MSFKTIYSLNVRVSFSPLKFNEFTAGLLRTIIGASESLGPPEGDTIFAHLGNILTISSVIKIKATNFFNPFDVLIVFLNSKVINL